MFRHADGHIFSLLSILSHGYCPQCLDTLWLCITLGFWGYLDYVDATGHVSAGCWVVPPVAALGPFPRRRFLRLSMLIRLSVCSTGNGLGSHPGLECF